jgi:hypothetical protein
MKSHIALSAAIITLGDYALSLDAAGATAADISIRREAATGNGNFRLSSP